DGRRDRRPRRGEHELDAEHPVQKAPDGALRAECDQKQIADDNRRHHERQMDETVKERLSPEPRARKHPGAADRKRQAGSRAPQRDPQTQQNRVDFGRGHYRAMENPYLRYTASEAGPVRNSKTARTSGRARPATIANG